MWAVLERESGVVIGDVGFLRTEGDGVEIGWHLHPSARGRGDATEAARACLDHGFATLGFDRVSAYVETANTASLRVIEKLGMIFVRSGVDGVPPWAEYSIERQAASLRPA